MAQLLLGLSALAMLELYRRSRSGMAAAGPFLPDSFLFGIALYAAGAIVTGLYRQEDGALQIIVLSLGCLVSGAAGATLFVLACGRSYRTLQFRPLWTGSRAGPREAALTTGLLWISSFVCAAFVVAVFSNSIVGALLSVASLTGEATLLDARKAITAGSDGWFAPGYVKQFRDILVPVALVATVAFADRSGRRIVVWVAASAALVAMLISGQRLVFVVFFLFVALARYFSRPASLPRGGARRSKFPWLAAVVLAALYAGLTVLLGRIDQGLSAGETLARVFINLADRVLLAAPRENLLTFAIWYPAGATVGESWVADLGGILPGVSEALSNILHAATGGSYAGNSPLGLPPDVWLSWGWWGIAIVPAVFAFFAGLLDLWLLASRAPLLMSMRLYLFVVLPICYSPYLFVLYGGAAAMTLIALVAAIRSGPWWRLSSAGD